MSRAAAARIRAGVVRACLPWPRFLLARESWAALVGELRADPALGLVALWADAAEIRALFVDEIEGVVLPVSVGIEADAYPALSPARPAAAWWERAIADLWGYRAAGGLDDRAWLDHGRWPLTRPLAARPGPQGPPPEPPAFLAAPDERAHQLPIGPVQGGLTEAAHWRLHALGEQVIGAEARLGYTHKGTLALIRGKSPRAAARFAARLAGDATVAHAIAFARAAEAALGVEIPARAVLLRAVMAELERASVHLGGIGMVCAMAGAPVLDVACQHMREVLLRAAGGAFGHRLLMDTVVPGGVAGDLTASGEAALRRALDTAEAGVGDIRRLYAAHGPLTDRLHQVGRVSLADADELAAGGFAGRASGRNVDARRFPGYPPYERYAPGVPVLRAGDADARVRVRLDETAASLLLARLLLDSLTDGPVGVALPVGSGEGIGCAEAARGAVWHWLRLEGGLIAAGFLSDPGWTQGPLLERALATGDVADAALCRISFQMNPSGVDL